MVKQTIRYVGALRCDAMHEPSKSSLMTDAPKDNEGLGQGFSPTDLVGTALATCMVTTMAIAARKKFGADLEHSEIRLEKEMASDPRRIGRLSLELRLAGPFTEEQRQELEKIGYNCPVMLSLNPEVNVEARIEWTR